MDRLSSSLLYMTIIAIITMASLCASYLDYVQQRVYIVVIFIGISLAAGIIAGLALGLVHAKSRKVATTALVLYIMVAIIASSVMYLNNTYIPNCTRRTIENFRNTKDIALYNKWCLDEADRNAFLQITEAALDDKAFEALLEKGLAHENPDCARLKFAIYDEDIDRVKAMVENGVDPNCTSAGIRPVVVVSMLKNKLGVNPGSQALLYEILELQEPLPKVTLQDIKGAITSHNYSALKELVKQFDVNIGETRLKDRYSVKEVNNPLALAILLADPESVLTLLEAGADTRQKAYHTVTASGKEETREGTLYELALGMHEINKNTQAGSLYTRIVNDMTRYHVFTDAEQKTIDQFMARQRAEEERQDRENDASLSAKYSPFYDAIKAGDLGTVKHYIENKKIDINFAEYESGYSTPLMTAVLANKIEIVDYLLKKNADVSIFTTDGEDALQCASGRGYLDIVRQLVAHGANINDYVDAEGRGPLVHAIRSGKVDVVKFLLSKGADLNAAQERASSLLYFAVESDNLAMIRFLVDSGLDVNAKHKYGKTPLDLAVWHKNQDIVSYLKAKGAKLSSQFPAR